MSLYPQEKHQTHHYKFKSIQKPSQNVNTFSPYIYQRYVNNGELSLRPSGKWTRVESKEDNLIVSEDGTIVKPFKNDKCISWSAAGTYNHYDILVQVSDQLT